MNILIWAVLGVLALKVIWNFAVPYALLWKKLDPKTGNSGGMSLSLEVEFLLLILTVGLSWFSKGNSPVNSPLIVLGFGASAILISYLHFFVGGMVANWLLVRKNRSQPPDS